MKAPVTGSEKLNPELTPWELYQLNHKDDKRKKKLERKLDRDEVRGHDEENE